MNHRQALVMGAIVATLAGVGPATAADKKNSFSLFGDISKNSGSDATGSVSVSYGRLFLDSLEVEGLLSYFLTAGQTSTNTLTGGAGVKYYFGAVGRGGAWVPYVFANGQGSRLKTEGQRSSSFRVYQAGVGIEYNVTEAASVFVQAAGQRSEFDNNSVNGSRLNLGVKIRF